MRESWTNSSKKKEKKKKKKRKKKELDKVIDLNNFGELFGPFLWKVHGGYFEFLTNGCGPVVLGGFLVGLKLGSWRSIIASKSGKL